MQRQLLPPRDHSRCTPCSLWKCPYAQMRGPCWFVSTGNMTGSNIEFLAWVTKMSTLLNDESRSSGCGLSCELFLAFSNVSSPSAGSWNALQSMTPEGDRGFPIPLYSCHWLTWCLLQWLAVNTFLSQYRWNWNRHHCTIEQDWIPWVPTTSISFQHSIMIPSDSEFHNMWQSPHPFIKIV
jgi:hypothetical protein